MVTSSSSGCTGDLNTDDLIVFADAAVDETIGTRNAIATSIGVGGNTGDVWPASGVPMPGASRTVDGDGIVSIANGYWTVAIPVDAGSTLEIAATVRDNGTANTTAPNTISMSLLSYSATQVVTLGTAVSDASGKPQTLTISSDHVVAPAEIIFLRFSPLASTTPPTFAMTFSQIRSITVTRRRTRTLVIPAIAASSPQFSAFIGVGGFLWRCTSSADHVAFPISLPSSSRIVSVTTWFNGAGAQQSVSLRRGQLATGLVSTIGSTTSSATGISSMTISTSYIVGGDEQLMADFACGGADTDVRAVAVNYL
jgi:hypothetical protein